MGEMRYEKPRQSFGKRAAKLFLPVLVGFNVPFLCVQIDSMLNPIDLDKAGKWAMDGSWTFDYVIVPVTVVVLFIVQWLIILPMWNGMIKFRRVLLSSLIIGTALSILVGILLGYIVWARQFGLNDLINSSLIMSGFVLVYCILNTLTLYFLDRSYIRNLKSQKNSFN